MALTEHYTKGCEVLQSDSEKGTRLYMRRLRVNKGPVSGHDLRDGAEPADEQRLVQKCAKECYGSAIVDRNWSDVPA